MKTPSMSGRMLLQSLSRRRSTFQCVYVRAFNQSHTNWILLDHAGNGVLPNDFCRRVRGSHPCPSHQRFYSVCTDRITLFDEGSETCTHHQQDLHVASEDQVNSKKEDASSPHKSKRAKRVKKEKEESCVVRRSSRRTTCGENQEGHSVVESEYSRAFQAALENGFLDNGTPQSIVRNLIGNDNEAAHSTLLGLDNVTSSLEKTSSKKDVNENEQECNHAYLKKDEEQHQGESKKGAIHLKSSEKLTEDSEKECYPKILDFSDVEQVFQALLIPKQSGLQKHERDSLAQVFKHFREAGWASEQALHRCHISAVVFPMAVSRFRRFFFSRCTPEIKMHLLKLGASADGDQFLFPLFAVFCNIEFPGEIARYKALVETADLTKPHTWFPFARAMKRKIVYHLGPTNSGKTYNALERFKKASSGLYCGPLRLLAMEVYDSVNADGVYCSLITGQERKEVPFANHVACTVEMVSLQKPWEVAIIDEIQMVADEYRGWAWTRAFLGVQANELHVCGDPSALSLVSHLCAVTGDELEQHSYERFEPLSIDERSLEGKYSNIKPGDCIVSFSRKEIFSIKRAVELFTGNRCCVIYGALPPETRTHQAKLFNDPNSGYDVLVATDAVGMGLNLNIRRVVFHTLDKYNGDMVAKVSASQVKQIAGRAGRRGTLYHIGVATTFLSRDIPHLVQCMQEPFVESPSAGLFPGSDQIELFASQLPDATFAKLLDSFAETCKIEGSFFLCRNDNLKKVASVIDKVKDLTLEDKMSFILAPVNSRDPKVVGALLSFALAYSKKLPVHLAMVTPTGSARSVLQLMDLEARHQVLSLYLWLSQHFPEEYFPQKEQAEQMATDIAFTLGESLAQTDIMTVQTDQRRSIDKKVLSNQRPLESQTRRARR